jgi:hypothetical protein
MEIQHGNNTTSSNRKWTECFDYSRYNNQVAIKNVIIRKKIQNYEKLAAV